MKLILLFFIVFLGVEVWKILFWTNILLIRGQGFNFWNYIRSVFGTILIILKILIRIRYVYLCN